MQHNQQIVFNGVDADSGDYLTEPRRIAEWSDLADVTQRPGFASQVDAGLARRSTPLRLIAGVDRGALAQTGWCVIVPTSIDAAIKEALQPLLQWRARQAGARYRRIDLDPDPDMSCATFLEGQGVGPGPVDPSVFPYYVLLVGGPEQISFDFQTDLAIAYAVGRLDLASPGAYARYAQAVVDAEQRRPARRHAVFFGVSRKNDRATELSRRELVEPIARDFTRRSQGLGWSVETIVGEEASKARLQSVVEAPSMRDGFLLTAAHGLGFRQPSMRQRALQGAVVCAEWHGPDRVRARVPGSHYFAGRDVGPSCRVEGAMCLGFGCYSAGTPERDTFFQGEGRMPIQARSDFVAQLPQALLGRGALAYVGHIDRAWTLSFDWGVAGPQLSVFNSLFIELLQGLPIGAAMDAFGERCGAIAVQLAESGARHRSDRSSASGRRRAHLLIAYHDAKNYVVLGDPAVRFNDAEN